MAPAGKPLLEVHMLEVFQGPSVFAAHAWLGTAAFCRGFCRAQALLSHCWTASQHVFALHCQRHSPRQLLACPAAQALCYLEWFSKPLKNSRFIQIGPLVTSANKGVFLRLRRDPDWRDNSRGAK